MENHIDDKLIKKWLLKEQDFDCKPITQNQINYWEMPNEWLTKCSELSLSRLDGFMLSLLFGFESGWLNSVANTPNKTLATFQDEIIKRFERALIKLPKTSGEFVYRMDNYYSSPEEAINWWSIHVGRNIEIPFFLGTSMEDWQNTEVVWRIKTLKLNSKGYKTFLFHDQAFEKEVRFLRGSKFFVKSVTEGADITYVDLIEISNDTDSNVTLYGNSYFHMANRQMSN